MSWDGLWGFFAECSKDVQRQILEQLDLKTFIKNKAPKTQIEILQHAPGDIVKSLQSLIHPNAQKKLGVSTMSLSDLDARIKGLFR